MEYLAWCWYSINICWKKSTCLGKVGRMLGGLDICPPFFHVFFQLFCLPSPVQPRIIQLLHILFLASRKWAFKEYLLCVCVIFRKTDVCRRGPGPHGAVLIPDRHFTEIYLETCGQPKGHRHHPSCQWACFCATSLPALLCSCVMEEQTFWLLLCCPLQLTHSWGLCSLPSHFTLFPGMPSLTCPLTSPHSLQWASSLHSRKFPELHFTCLSAILYTLLLSILRSSSVTQVW